MQCGSRRPWQIPVGHGTLLCTDQGEHQNLICVDLQCYESTFLQSCMCIKRLLSMIKMHLCSCHLCLHRIWSPVFLSCVQGEGKDQIKPNQNHRDGWWKAARITREWGTTREKRLEKSNSFHLENWSLKKGFVNDCKYFVQIDREKRKRIT